jgi:hypothetical protein
MQIRCFNIKYLSKIPFFFLGMKRLLFRGKSIPSVNICQVFFCPGLGRRRDRLRELTGNTWQRG